MAILQALLSLISRSAGKIFNAIFGWAVRALFGTCTPKEQTMLSVLVGAAALWPLLLCGIALPKIAALVLALVPLPSRVPKWTVRLVWTALALIVPITVGLVLAARAPQGTPRESFVKRVARGFPITLGLSGAFLFMFLTIPALRLIALARRRTTQNIPLITDAASYHDAAAAVAHVLRRHRFALAAARPGWSMRVPQAILLRLGGKAFRGFIPERLEYFRAPELEVALYPNGLVLTGYADRVAWAHALVAETMVHSEALQTVDPVAQSVEHEIHRVWRLLDEQPEAHAHSRILRHRLDEICGRLGEINVPFDEWQILYRETLQLGRAFDGRPPLLDRQAEPNTDDEWEEITMERHPAASPERSTTRALVGEIIGTASALVKKEVELAKVELRADLVAEKKMAIGVGVAGVFALVTLCLIAVAAALALGRVIPEWAGALCVGGATLAVAALAGLIGWGKRVKTPLAETRRTLAKEIQWTKERLA